MNKILIYFIIVLVLIGGFVFYKIQRSETPPLEEARIASGIMQLTSPSFQANQSIPPKYTCDGEDINPLLKISGVPEEAKSLALIVDDSDAPMGSFVHWVVWNIEPQTTAIEENDVPGGVTEGKNDFNNRFYGGPCPPGGIHHYHFKLYALNGKLNLNEDADKETLLRAMDGHILDQTELVGTYQR